MFSFSVIPYFDILKYSQFSLFLCKVMSMINQFSFQRFKEAFSYCIIPTDLPIRSCILGSFPFLLMLCNTGRPFRCSLKSEHAYCTPLSEWNNRCCVTGLFLIAIFQARIVVSAAFIVSLGSEIKSHLRSAQPTTFRSAKSNIAVRYSHPCSVLI